MDRTNVQMVSLAVIVAIMVVEGMWMRCHRQKWRWAVPLLVWMAHSLVFYLFVLLTDVPMTGWSSVLRLHGYLSVLGTEILRLRLGDGC